MDDSPPRVPAKPSHKPNDPLVALVLFLVPLMMLILALPPYHGNAGLNKVEFVLSVALVTAIISAIVWWRTSTTLPLILLGVSLLLIANICWGKAFRQQASRRSRCSTDRGCIFLQDCRITARRRASPTSKGT